jgi:hypothetical protein
MKQREFIVWLVGTAVRPIAVLRELTNEQRAPI